MALTADRVARVLGLAGGLALCAALLLAWRVESESGALGADATFTVAPPGELTLSSTRPLLRARGLRPGGSGAGKVELRNITGRPLDVRVRLLPSSRELDGLMYVSLESRGRRFASGTLGDLRHAGPRALRIPATGSRPLELRARLTGAGDEGDGRLADVTVELQATPAGRRP